jgi:uncharacterized membrane protein
MNFSTILWTTILALLPISELRGAIPYALSQGVPWYIALPYSVFINILVAPICWIFLATIHHFLYRFNWYHINFDRIIQRAQRKVHDPIEKWGWLGIAIFVGIPLPFTGAWTGTIGSWVLGLEKKKTFLAVCLGVALAGIIVTTVILLGITAFSIFVKQV